MFNRIETRFFNWLRKKLNVAGDIAAAERCQVLRGRQSAIRLLQIMLEMKSKAVFITSTTKSACAEDLGRPEYRVFAVTPERAAEALVDLTHRLSTAEEIDQWKKCFGGVGGAAASA
jgi:hypothetical protein